MISVMIATQNQERTLGQVLAALVPGAVDGVVRQVIVVDGGSTDSTLDIAKDSGADVLELDGPPDARLRAGCARAKGDWLLFLDPQVRPPPGWEAAARAHIAGDLGRAAWFATARGGLFGGPPKAHGLLVSRRLLDEVGGYGPGLAGKLGGRLKRLKPVRDGF
jgi:glycosyltransferase involved in cell wall biosynthesis